MSFSIKVLSGRGNKTWILIPYISPKQKKITITHGINEFKSSF